MKGNQKTCHVCSIETFLLGIKHLLGQISSYCCPPCVHCCQRSSTFSRALSPGQIVASGHLPPALLLSRNGRTAQARLWGLQLRVWSLGFGLKTGLRVWCGGHTCQLSTSSTFRGPGRNESRIFGGPFFHAPVLPKSLTDQWSRRK